MSSPLVTVVVPTLGEHALLFRSLSSLASQDYKPIQVIVVFDSFSERRSIQPTDLEEAFRHRFFSLLVLEAKGIRGAAANRNVALRSSTGQFVCFLDDDDEFLPNKVSVQVSFMEREASDFSHSDYIRVVDDSGVQKFRKIDTSRNRGFHVPQQISEGVCRIATPTVMVRASLLAAHPKEIFPEQYSYGEDQIAWMRIAHSSASGVRHIGQPLSKVHIRSGSLQRLQTDPFNEIRNQLKLSRSLLGEARRLGVQRAQMVRILNASSSLVGRVHLLAIAVGQAFKQRNI